MTLIDIEKCAWRFVFPALCLAIYLGTIQVPIGGAQLLNILSRFSAGLWAGYLLFGGKVLARFVLADGSWITSRIACSRLLTCAALIGVLAACAYRHVWLNSLLS